MRFNQQKIQAMASRKRALFINSLSGFKSANLLGSCDREGKTNLALMSSTFHIGADPALAGLLFRPHTVARHSLENILDTGYYTLNHVAYDMVDQAHQTSARYAREDSEFDATGLDAIWLDNFPAPFVKQSRIKTGFSFVEKHELQLNGTIIVIGRIELIDIPSGILQDDGYLDIEKAGSAAISSLDAYHTTSLIKRLPYAKV